MTCNFRVGSSTLSGHELAHRFCAASEMSGLLLTPLPTVSNWFSDMLGKEIKSSEKVCSQGNEAGNLYTSRINLCLMLVPLPHPSQAGRGIPIDTILNRGWHATAKNLSDLQWKRQSLGGAKRMFIAQTLVATPKHKIHLASRKCEVKWSNCRGTPNEVDTDAEIPKEIE